MTNTIAPDDRFGSLAPDRKEQLQQIAKYINTYGIKSILFVCTHNSRRSQFAQIAFNSLAVNKDIWAFSAGTEVTAVYPSVIEILKALDYSISSNNHSINPVYSIKSNSGEPLGEFWSKSYEDSSIPQENILAVMTCSDAEQNCPYIPFASGRIPLRYEDPKFADGTPEEMSVYSNKYAEIYTEMQFMVDLIRN